MKRRTRIGILGGTFDPPHIGHLMMAEFALDAADLDHVILMPAFQPPHKAVGGASAAQRLAMTRLAIKGNRRMLCSPLEVKRKGLSYTVDTIEALATKHPGSELYLLLGMDSFLEFSSWKSPERIVAVARLLVFPRPGWRMATDVPFARHADMMASPGVELSSSLIRRRVAAGKSIRYLVPDAVERFIRTKGLYRPAR